MFDKPVQRVLHTALAGLAVLGLLTPTGYNWLPAESMIEATFILCSVFVVRGAQRGTWSLLAIATVYLSVKVALAVLYGDDGPADFIQAYKAYFYLIALVFFVNRAIFNQRHLARLVGLLAITFFLKYAYARLLGLDDRPGVFMENNFELVMLLGLFYLAYPALGRMRSYVFFIVAATVLISGSRSAAVGLLCVYIALNVRRESRLWPLHLVGTILVGYLVIELFASRMTAESLESVDRYRFLEIFLREVRPWGSWEFFTGSFPLTPLSSASCQELSYYTDLFSQSSPGSCYSVILHSYLLRAIFDQGIVGLTLLYGVVWVALRRSGAPRRDGITLLSLITANAFSVSAFNNVFVAIVLAVALGLDRKQARKEREPTGAWTIDPSATKRASEEYGRSQSSGLRGKRRNHPSPHLPDDSPGAGEATTARQL